MHQVDNPVYIGGVVVMVALALFLVLMTVMSERGSRSGS